MMAASFWDAIFFVGGKPYFCDEGFTVGPMHLALHRCPESCSSIGPQCVLQLRQKRDNWLPYQIYFARSHQFERCPVRQLDDTTLVQCDDRRWAGFNESAQPLLCFQGEPAVAKKFRTNSPHPKKANISKLTG